MNKEMTLKDGINRLFSMIWVEKWLFCGGMFFMILTTLAMLVDPLIIAHIIDFSVPNNDLKDMFLWGSMFAVMVLISGWMSYLRSIWMAKLGLKVITSLKNNLFNHLLLLPIKFFDKTPAGVLIARVESDCERVKELFSQFSITIVGNILFFIGMFIVLFAKNWQVTLYLFLPLSITIALTIFIIKYLTKYYTKSRELTADLTGRLTEYIQGINTIQLFNHQNKAEDYVNIKSKEKQLVDTKAGFIEYGAWGVNDFFMSYILVIIIVLLISPKVIDGAVSIGLLVVFLQYSARLVWPIMQIAENMNQFQRAFVSLKRVFGLLEEEPEINNNESGRGKPYPYDVFTNEIEFKNVWFKYKDDEWVLKDISFTIKKGSKIALVGSSGSGKTTTISLLCRFYDIQKGNIYVDGVDLYSIPLEVWRKKIGLILQDIVLFPGNLLENIRIYNDDISLYEVKKAIEVSHSDILLERLDNDLESEIIERGQNLSMGERQLVSFARAVCFNPEIIIMDEATASIDAKTENLIQASMDETLKGKTAVIIAHRLVSVLDSDEILLFQNGEIKNRGTHHELLNDSEEYKKLVELQFLKEKLD